MQLGFDASTMYTYLKQFNDMNLIWIFGVTLWQQILAALTAATCTK